MTYDPGYGNQPPYSDRSPVPDVSQPYGGPPGYGPPVQVSPPAYPGHANVVQAADPGPRPSTVTAAVALVFVGVGLAFIGTVLNHLYWTEAFKQLSSGSAEVADTLNTFTGAMTFIGAGVNLLAAAGASICAIIAMKGSNGARITLCVLCGLFAGWKLMCGGYSLVTSTTGQVAAEMRKEVGDAIYLLYAALGVDFVLMVVAIGIVALLMVGVSNRFFNPPKVPATPAY
jgi:hypothetical protein